MLEERVLPVLFLTKEFLIYLNDKTILVEYFAKL